MNNYTIVDNSMITNIKISDGAFRLYTMLTSMCYGNKNTCYPSQKYLAEKLGKSVRQIQRLLLELVEAKLISKRRRGSISNVYTILNKVVSNTIQKVESVVNKVKKAYTTSKKQSTFNSFKGRSYSKEDLKNIEYALLGWT